MKETLKIMICLTCLLSGLMVPAASAEARDGQHMVEIHVVRQETLIGICKQYLAQPEAWRRIAEINRLADPDHISPGQTIKLPVEMLKGVPLEGTVTLLKGTVARKTASQAGWNSLNLHDIVTVGSALRTGKDSAVEITFEDGTAFLLRENSEVTVKRAGKGVLHLLRTLYLESGKVISRIRAATGRDSRFEVETPSALAAARGTEYRVAVDEGRTTRLETLENSIDVSAGNTTVVVRKGEGSIVRMNEPPTEPVKLLAPPEPETIAPIYGNTAGEIRFSNVEKAVRYRVVLARDPEGRHAVRTAVIRPDDTFRFEGLDDGSYYLITSSFDGDGLEGTLSRPREIKVLRKPEPPTIISPSNDAMLPEMPMRITWYRVLGATAYRLQISRNRDFSDPVIDSGTIMNTAYNLKELPAGSYCLRVKSLGEGGREGDWSDIRTFSVARLAPPTIRSQADNDEQPYLEWRPIQGAARYRLQISRSDDFKVVTLDMTLTQTKAMLVNPLEPGKYHVRVSGIDSDWQPGGFSQVGSFVVEKKEQYFFETLGAVGAAGVVLLLLLL